jgi:hypothetical protein
MNPIKMKKDKIKTAHWLLGQWEAQSDGGTLTETWKKQMTAPITDRFIS